MNIETRKRNRLTHEQVLQIRSMRNIRTKAELARRYEVSFRTIVKVLDGEIYKYLELNPMEISPDAEIIQAIIRERYCSGCEKTLALNIENFHRKGNGFQFKCRPCMISGNAHNRHIAIQRALNIKPSGTTIAPQPKTFWRSYAI